MRRFWMRLQNAFARFFYGRNGYDRLSRALLWVYIALWVGTLVGTLLENVIVYLIFSLASTALLFYIFFRILSRNVAARRREEARVFSYFALQKKKRRERKTHVYRKCPKCKALLRLPRKKGKHTVCCPACKERFEVRI